MKILQIIDQIIYIFGLCCGITIIPYSIYNLIILLINKNKI